MEASDQTPNKLRELGLDFKDLSNPEIVTEKLEAYLKTERGKTDISLAKNINLIKKFLGHDPSHSLGDEDASSLGAFGG